MDAARAARVARRPADARWRRKTKVYFATDLHGSSKCFRKFVNAGTGVRRRRPGPGRRRRRQGAPDDRPRTRRTLALPFIGTDYDVEDGPELEALEKLIADHGYYPLPGRARRARRAGRRTARLDAALRRADARAGSRAGWSLADERLRPPGKRLYFMLGNDDPDGAAVAPRRGDLGRSTTRAGSSCSTTTTR